MSPKKDKTVVIIAGPTAVGKTAIAIDIASQLGTAIISADSRQCYTELDVGVGRPSVEQLSSVPHYFIASHSIHEDVNAIIFEQYALEKLATIFQSHDVAVIAGGTGLYIKALCEGLDDIPQVSPGIREKISNDFQRNGLKWLQNEVQQKDAAFYKTAEVENPQRLMRALEVLESTGRSILQFRKGEKAIRNFNIVRTGLELPKEVLHSNINSRVDNMIENELLKEVEGLLPYKDLNPLQTVGYSEIFSYFGNLISLDSAVELIKKNTRQYAKRQMTWFKKDAEITWFDPGQPGKFKEYIRNVI